MLLFPRAVVEAVLPFRLSPFNEGAGEGDLAFLSFLVADVVIVATTFFFSVKQWPLLL